MAKNESGEVYGNVAAKKVDLVKYVIFDAFHNKCPLVLVKKALQCLKCSPTRSYFVKLVANAIFTKHYQINTITVLY